MVNALKKSVDILLAALVKSECLSAGVQANDERIKI